MENMSKYNEIIDDWEEIDEDALCASLKKLREDMNPPDTEGPTQNGDSYLLMMRSGNDYSASYVESSSIKILRRPTQHSNDHRSNDIRPKQPVKTLQQREQAYAEARLRILGSAKNPEDEIEIPIMDISSKPEMSYSNGEFIPPPSNRTFRNTTYLPCDNILRMPRGPDGTAGFKIRR